MPGRGSDEQPGKVVVMKVTRRSLVLAGVTTPMLLALSACKAGEAPPATRKPKPKPSAQPTASGTSRPSNLPSYGPNGTHYPADLPWIGEKAATDIEVQCSWQAISQAIESLTAKQVADGAVIRVRPGTLVGAGAGSRRTPVLSGVGKAAWTRSVVVCPRDGYGSVQVLEQGFRIDNCSRLALFGFKGGDVEFYATNCSYVTVGWSQWSGLSFTQSGSNIALYEIVLGFRRSPTDTFSVRPTPGNAMTDLSRYGCAFGPSVKAVGDGSHCDTSQLERTGAGDFGPYTSTDCVDFGSSNSVVLVQDALSMAQFNHCLLLGAQLPWQIYPLQAGDYQGNPNAFAGGGRDVRLYDSVVAGPVGRMGFTHVVNTTLSYRPVAIQEPSVEGSWSVDESIATWTASDIEQTVGGAVTPAALTSHWDW
jgi:hypothetical protein